MCTAAREKREYFLSASPAREARAVRPPAVRKLHLLKGEFIYKRRSACTAVNR